MFRRRIIGSLGTIALSGNAARLGVGARGCSSGTGSSTPSSAAGEGGELLKKPHPLKDVPKDSDIPDNAPPGPGDGAPAPPSPPGDGKGNNSKKDGNDGTQPAPGSPGADVGVPKGFNAAYSFPFRRPGTVPLNQAVQASLAELTIIERLGEQQKKFRRRRRWFLSGIVVGLFGFYYARTRGYDSKKILKALGLDDGQVEEETLETPVASIYVNLHKHVATYYDAAGKYISGRYFVDFINFESNLKDSPETSNASVFVNIYNYFPWTPMFLLLLIPVLTYFHDSFTLAGRLAQKTAMQAPGSDKKFKFATEKNVKTKLNSVAGLTEAKHEVVEIIDFLKNPTRYTSLGARLPKGVLLDGPPGVGKTLIAKAVAGEALVPFVSCSGSEFDEVFVGVGAQRVRELFKEARRHAPCVVFIDEIDAFGKKRQSDGRGGSRGTLNALLSELDGFKDATGIIVLAATNRADILDSALTRSGRFDRKISLEKPPHKDRVEISKVHLAPLVLDPSMTLDSASEQLASLTPGCSGADIYNICNEAAIIASREGRDNVNMACFHKALERVLVGLEKKAKKFNVDEKRRLAYHEAGHVILNWYQSLTDPVVKASIVPRGGEKVGVTQKLPQDKFIRTQEELRQIMIARLGGLVVEEMFFEDLSTSASDDLRGVTELAWSEVCTYGMDTTKIGHVHYETSDSAIAKPYGPKKEDDIDESVSDIVAQSLKAARAMMKQHIEKVRIVGGLLLKQETVTAVELWRVLGDRPVMSEEFTKFLTSRT